MLASEVMNTSAALLNDTALSIFTYTTQIPYLNMALAELQEECELNNVPITNQTATVLAIASGVIGIGGGGTQPSLPPGLIEPLDLQERVSGTGNAFIPMTRVDFLPSQVTASTYLQYWEWSNENIKFVSVGASGIQDIKIHYIKSIFGTIISENDSIVMNNSKTFLGYRTAALCAQFIGENEGRAGDLNTMAMLALARTLGISTKGRQSIFTRRRPFNAAWRSRRVV
jgi:hypothetical protein